MARMPELDFIETIQSEPLTDAEIGEIQNLIRQHHASKATATRERIEAEALALPAAERVQLVQRVVASLANGGSQPASKSAPETTKTKSSPTPRRQKSASRKVVAGVH